MAFSKTNIKVGSRLEPIWFTLSMLRLAEFNRLNIGSHKKPKKKLPANPKYYWYSSSTDTVLKKTDSKKSSLPVTAALEI